MTIRVLLALLALMFCFQAEAADVMIYGRGFHSCGAWTKNQVQRPAVGTSSTINSQSDVEMAAEMEWVDGFISAFNIYRSTTGNVVTGTDMNGVYAWIDNYCAAHPLDKIAGATDALLKELSQRQSE
jgi:hypothetical protein